MATNQPVHPLMARTADIGSMVPYWNKVGAIVEGLDAIRAGGDDFLPKFAGEDMTDYKFRLDLSKFTNIYRDVLEGLATKPFEEEITLIGNEDKIPESIYKFVEDVDGYGNNLSTFAALTFFNGINYAIDWIFVDFPTVNTDRPLSLAEAELLNLKPFWTHILAKNVLEVRTERVGAKHVLSYIRLQEPEFNDTPLRIRVFERDSLTGEVSWKLYEDTGPDKKPEDRFITIGEGLLSIKVIPFVPFATGRRDGNSFKFFPAMKDAADLQITLYQNESALEYIKTMAGYPMLAANGMTPPKGPDGKPEKVAIGPARVLYGKPDGNGGYGEWKFIEPNANSMEFLQKNIDKTKQDLRELGRQPLTALSTQLTTTTTAIAAGKARSAVTAWALLLKDALENALVITAMWMNVTYDPQVNVYTGFDNVMDDGSDLDTLLTMREKGDLSRETLWFEMKRRKVLSPEFDPDSEIEEILEEIPSEEPDSPETSTLSDSDDEDATIG